MRVNLSVDASDLKMLRENLLTAMAAMRSTTVYKNGGIELTEVNQDYQVKERYLNDLINEIDKLRPLDNAGKHRNYHTPFCGCEDKGPTYTWRKPYRGEL